MTFQEGWRFLEQFPREHPPMAASGRGSGGGGGGGGGDDWGRRSAPWLLHHLLLLLALLGVTSVTLVHGGHPYRGTGEGPHRFVGNHSTHQRTTSKDLSHLQEGSLNPEGKFLFTIIQFPNVLCGSGVESGTCFTASECSSKGGTNIGSCADDYGTCCRVRLAGCGGDVRVNNTVITNTEYPGYYTNARTCVYKIYFDDSRDGDICQLRFDFIAFQSKAPSTLGVCETDKMIFEQDTKSTYFCGNAPDDYHWYVDTPGTSSPHTLSISNGFGTTFRRYAIRVSMIPCNQRIPRYCGQYYTGTSGTVSSFNYDNGEYLAGLSYSICFRKEEDYCTYTLKKTSNNQYIGTPDNLRLMMGSEIDTIANPSVGGSSFLCPLSATKRAMLYYSSIYCFYPASMTSSQTTGAFFMTIRTVVDNIVNHNPAVTSLAGFEFDWTTNSC